MEYFSPKQNKTLSEEELKSSIARAYQTAIKIDDYDKKIVELRNLRQERTKGLLEEKKEQRYQALNKEITDSEILVPSIMEYQKVLELLGLPKQKINEILNHENAHANVAEQVVSQTLDGFRIRFHKDKDGKVSFTPQIKTTTDMAFSEKQRLEEDILVTEAPLHYGDKLSARDKDVIEQAKNRLSKL